MRDDYIVWLDLETTGSDLGEGHEIIEIGAVLTDEKLTQLNTISVVIKPSAISKKLMAPIVVDMHTKNGLLSELDGGVTVFEAQNLMLSWLPLISKRIPIGGSGVASFDRSFLRYYMPVLSNRFTYWHYDVGVIRRMFGRRAEREDLMPEFDTGNKKHRALDDAILHLDEWRHYEMIIKNIPTLEDSI